VINKLLSIYRDVLDKSLPALADVVGYKAEIYQPIVQDSVYEKDTDIIYSDTPDWTQNVLITGIFSEGFPADLSQDNWFEEDIVWYQSWSDKLPEINAKIKVYLDNDNYLLFRVIDIKEVVTGLRVLNKIYLEGIGG
jgi:hypothetical protein